MERPSCFWTLVTHGEVACRVVKDCSYWSPVILEKDNCPQVTEKGHKTLVPDTDVSGLWRKEF